MATRAINGNSPTHEIRLICELIQSFMLKAIWDNTGPYSVSSQTICQVLEFSITHRNRDSVVIGTSCQYTWNLQEEFSQTACALIKMSNLMVVR